MKDSEELRRLFFDRALDGMLLADAETQQFYASNKAMEKMLGYTSEQIKKLRVPDIHPKEGLPYALEQFEKLLEQRTTLARDVQIKRRDGTAFYADISAFVGTYGGRKCLFGVFRDITERRQAEKAMRESESHYRSLFEESLYGICTVGPDFKFRQANTAFCTLLEYREEELVGKRSIGDVTHPDDMAASKRLLQKLVDRDLDHFIVEKRYITKSGRGVCAITFVRGFYDEAGRYVGSIASVTDITDRKQKEEALRESEAKYRTLVEQSLQGIAIAQGPPPHFVFVNLAMAEMLGYTRLELTSLLPEEAEALVHPEDRAVFFGLIIDSIQGKHAVQCEVRGIRKDGEVRWLELYPVKIEYNGQPAVQVTFADITDRKQAEKTIMLERDRERKFLDVVVAIIVVIRADERISLMNKKGCEILGYGDQETIGKNWFDTFIPMRDRKSVREVFAKLMKGETEPFEFYYNHVLSKSGEERAIAWHNVVLRDEKGNIDAALSYGQDITDRIDVVGVKSEADIIKARVRTKALAEALGFNYMDQTKIASAVLELARNAFRYAGGGNVTIQPAERGGRGGIEIIVEDHGPGIANLELALKGGYSTSGALGEGLSNCKRFMDEFDIKTKVGKGTLVRITKWL